MHACNHLSAKTLEFICGYIDQTLSWHNEAYELHASALCGWLVYSCGLDNWSRIWKVQDGLREIESKYVKEKEL